jgi:hypothetical protein
VRNSREKPKLTGRGGKATRTGRQYAVNDTEVDNVEAIQYDFDALNFANNDDDVEQFISEALGENDDSNSLSESH